MTSIVVLLIASSTITGVVVWAFTTKSYNKKIKEVRIAFNSAMLENRKVESLLKSQFKGDYR